MICKKCGAENPEDVKICLSCGESLEESAPKQEEPEWHSAAQLLVHDVPQARPAEPKPKKMKWHKFLIYFALWVSGIGNILYGICCMTGLYLDYGPNRVPHQLVYQAIRSRQYLDMGYGLALVLVGVLLIIARFKIAKLKRGGPGLMYVAYLLSCAFQLLFLYGEILFCHLYPTMETVYSQIAGCVGVLVYLLLNWIYYRKRSSMFKK